MLCDKKAVLLLAWMQATRAYSQAVANLSHAVGAGLYADYALDQRKAATLRDSAHEARQRLEEHERQHHC